MSNEIQAEINRIAAEQAQEIERSIREIFGRLLSEGRIEDAKRASADVNYFRAVAAEYKAAAN